MPKIDQIPGAFWVALIGGLSSIGTVYLVTQYPENAPAWVAAALAACSVAVGLAKVLWPTSAPPAPAAQGGLPLPASGATLVTGQPAIIVPAARASAVARFFF